MRLMDLQEGAVKVNTKNIITPDIKKLAEMFEAEGYQIRVVGGAVRDAILGKEPKDIDLATSATPEEMLAIGRKYHVHVIETGLQHGTLTFRINGENYEITTLRIDVATDGRHAEVEWTRDFKLDAGRRDLTINSLSMDMAGRVYDYFGGINDLKSGTVKFVGDADKRIQEDFLRVLRLLRFFGRQNKPQMDHDTILAVKRNAGGLQGVSGERVWMEMSKIITGGHVKYILDLMLETGVAQNIKLPVRNTAKVAHCQSFTNNPVTLLSIMVSNLAEWETIVQSWKLSTPERELGAWLIKNRDTTMDKTLARNMIINGAKPEFVGELAAVQSNNSVKTFATSVTVPTFPVTGNDLLALGMKPGKEFGNTLQRLKARWVVSLDKIPLTREQLLGELE